VRTITTIAPNPALLAAAAESVSALLRSPSHNLKYIGLDALAGACLAAAPPPWRVPRPAAAAARPPFLPLNLPSALKAPWVTTCQQQQQQQGRQLAPSNLTTLLPPTRPQSAPPNPPAGIVKISPQYAQQHQLAVVDCLEDPDDTLKLKTLELLYRMTKSNNVEVGRWGGWGGGGRGGEGGGGREGRGGKPALLPPACSAPLTQRGSAAVVSIAPHPSHPPLQPATRSPTFLPPTHTLITSAANSYRDGSRLSGGHGQLAETCPAPPTPAPPLLAPTPAPPQPQPQPILPLYCAGDRRAHDVIPAHHQRRAHPARHRAQAVRAGRALRARHALVHRHHGAGGPALPRASASARMCWLAGWLAGT
jgi:hypothetical protein